MCFAPLYYPYGFQSDVPRGESSSHVLLIRSSEEGRKREKGSESQQSSLISSTASTGNKSVSVDIFCPGCAWDHAVGLFFRFCFFFFRFFKLRHLAIVPVQACILSRLTSHLGPPQAPIIPSGHTGGILYSTHAALPGLPSTSRESPLCVFLSSRPPTRDIPPFTGAGRCESCRVAARAIHPSVTHATCSPRHESQPLYLQGEARHGGGTG